MYVVRSWPRLSQTFIVGEVLALERLGVELEIFLCSKSPADPAPAKPPATPTVPGPVWAPTLGPMT